MKVALVHYWLVGMRGGEQVLEALCDMFPDADIYTHVAVPDRLSATIRNHRITETFIAWLPFARLWYPRYLPLMPLALEALDLTGYDLIISSEAGPSKGIVPGPDAIHLCYCHSPMRYIWDQYHIYRKQAGRFTRMFMPIFAHYLRMWDATATMRVDLFVANSNFVAKRIRKFYRREASVVHPPVMVDQFLPAPPADHGNYYLWCGELVRYKRPDLAIDAFNVNGQPLIVIGDGEERKRLEAKANSNIIFLGRASFEVVKHHAARCRALIFPGTEDFGIVPLEVQAAGRPVIAFAKGGALETVIDGETGVLFHDDSVDGLCRAIARFEAIEIDHGWEATCRQNAMNFHKTVFVCGITSALATLGIDVLPKTSRHDPSRDNGHGE